MAFLTTLREICRDNKMSTGNYTQRYDACDEFYYPWPKRDDGGGTFSSCRHHLTVDHSVN